jgi:nitroreductase
MNPTISEQQLLDFQNWRYATKSFDPVRKIPAATWEALMQALLLSPSSFGLQPYRAVLIEDPGVRARLKPHSWGQTQVVDASHYIVLAGRTSITEAEIDAYLELTANGSLLSHGAAARIPQWAALQAYIALGNLMTSAALLGVDTCPIEGFVPAEYDEILQLPSQGYAAVVCCALGYRSSTDKYAGAPKVRYPLGDFLKTV